MALTKNREITMSLLPHQAVDNDYILKEIKKNPVLKDFKVASYKIIRKSIDARKNPVKINLGILVSENIEVKVPFNKKEYLL